MIDSKENYKFDLGIKALRCTAIEGIHLLEMPSKEVSSSKDQLLGEASSCIRCPQIQGFKLQ